MLYITGGDLKEGKAAEFQEWVQENEETLAETAPDGWTYRGSYFAVHNIGPFDAGVMWEMEKYGDLDTAREMDEPQKSLIGNLQEFFMPGSGDTILLREAGDTRIFEPE